MPNPEPSGPSLADLIEAVQSANLTDLQKRDRISAIRTAAKALDAEPRELPLNVKLLRRRLEEVSPAALPRPLTASRWANVRSLLNRSLELKTEVAPSAQRTPVSSAWKALASALTRSNSLRLGALLRFLSARGVEPGDVTLSDLDAFRDNIIENRLRSAPEKTWDGIRWTWNKCVQDVEGWPEVTIPSVDRRIVYARPWGDFPESLKADVGAYLKVLSGEVIDEDGPLRALRLSTLKNRDYQARAAASVLAARGQPIERLRGLSDIARLEPIKVILNEVLNRGGGGHRAGAFNMANFLKACAQHWVQVDAAELAKIRRITSKLSPKQKGMTGKNRSRLMPFNNPGTVRSLLNLPFRLAEEVRRDGRKTTVNAVTAQLAVAIAILTAVPLRVANLAALDLREHLVDHGGRLFVTISADEVKNERDYLMEFPREVADLIAWYCLEHRDQLIERPTTALFPGEDGLPKKPGTLSVQIGKRIEQHLGIPVNAHLFRHLAAKLYLDRRPGEYALVSRVLNHKSVATTMAAYTGMESISAGLHYQSVVAGILASDSIATKSKRRPAR
jgi:integrase